MTNNAQAELVGRLAKLRSFLDGSGEIDGLSFGEPKPISPTRNGAFWWRSSHLPAIDQAAAEIERMAGEVEALRAALKLASNRLARCAVESIADGKANQYEWSEWANEAREAALGGGE